MNCSDFEKRLERYEAGTLPGPERRETDQHLFRCPSCRALLEAVQAGQRSVAQMDLSRAVLARTTGSACLRCRSLLGDLVDGVVGPLDSELIHSHLESCSSCSSLFGAMSELAEVLPRMREMVPDSSFVGDVLRATRLMKHERPVVSRILEFFRSLTERPRFSWEAAYLGALLVFALFGAPFSPVHDASSRVLASLQDRQGLVALTDSTIQGWKQDAQIVMDASERVRQTVGRMTARSAETAEQLIEQARQSLRQSEASVASAGKSLKSGVVDVYKQARHSKAAPKR